MAAPKVPKDACSVAGSAREPPQAPIMEFGDIRLDMLTRQITAGGHSQKLSPKEFPLVYELVSQAGKYVDRARLCAAMGSANNDTSLENHLYRLRKKLKGIGCCIVAGRGRGHRLEKIKD